MSFGRKGFPKPLNMSVTYCIQMVTTQETTVKASRWLVEEIDKFVNKNMKNASDFPSKRNFVDRAIMRLLEEYGVDLSKK